MMHTAPMTRTYTITDLTDRTGFSRFAIYKYIRLGIVPPAHGRGRAAYYTDAHLRGLREVRQAHDARITLADLAERARTS